MTLDIPTLALVTGCLSLRQVIPLAIVWSVNQDIPGLGRWALRSLFSGFSLALMFSRQALDNELLNKVLSTLLAWGGLFCAAAAAFQGKRAALKWPLRGCVPCLAGYLWFGWGVREIRPRPAFYKVPVVWFMARGYLRP